MAKRKPKTNEAYWKDRAKEAKKINAQTADQTAENVRKVYEQAMKDIQDRIDLWYQRFATNEGMTLAAAHEVLTSDELYRFRMDLQEYIEACQALGKDIDPEWLLILESASAVHHIERFEAIKIQTRQALEILAGKQRQAMDEGTRESYKEGLFHTVFSIQDAKGEYTFCQIDEGKLERVIKKPWAPDGEAFSDRIWKNKKKLVNELHTIMVQHCTTGAPVDKVAEELAKKMETAKYNAERLVRTEAAHFAAEGDMEGYRETDVEQYQWIAGLDHKTCPLCAELDYKIFDLDDAVEGATMPPRHPNCRCTTIPYDADLAEFHADDTRAARDPITNKTVQVPAMSYADWKKQYVDSDEKAEKAFNERRKAKKKK